MNLPKRDIPRHYISSNWSRKMQWGQVKAHISRTPGWNDEHIGDHVYRCCKYDKQPPSTKFFLCNGCGKLWIKRRKTVNRMDHEAGWHLATRRERRCYYKYQKVGV